MVLDSVGAALRGDMSVPLVLLEEVSENISNRMNNNQEHRWAEATWHGNQKGWGKVASESPHTHLLEQSVCE